MATIDILRTAAGAGAALTGHGIGPTLTAGMTRYKPPAAPPGRGCAA